MMKRILLLATGGTIASRQSDNGLHPAITPEELMTYVPEAAHYCEVDTLQVLNIDSTNILPSHWLTIANAIESHYEEYDGFVVCHGTDTLAYTAAALSYLIQNSRKPIVLTGSQKPIDLAITDGKTNLYDSLVYASSSEAHGVSIVFNGRVIAGTRARKTRTRSYHAFSSINFPSLAKIHDGKIINYFPKDIKDQVSFSHTLNASVAGFKLTPGVSSKLLALFLEHYDAIMIEGFGVGGVPCYENDDYAAVIDDYIQKGKTIVIATQVPHEGSDMSIYQVGQIVKQKYNLLEAYDMTTEAVVTKLMWILGQTSDPELMKTLFYTKINYDILT